MGIHRAQSLVLLFLLCTCSLLAPFLENTKYRCYTDDCKIYLPLAHNCPGSIQRLLTCLEYVKFCMAMNFLSFDESKTEVILFRPNNTSCNPLINYSWLGSYTKQHVTNLGVIMDLDFKFNKQISSVLQKSFIQLRQISKLKPVLSRQDMEKVIHAFISTQLDYCNAPYVGVSQAFLSHLQHVQNAASRLLTGTHRHEHIYPVLSSLASCL